VRGGATLELLSQRHGLHMLQHHGAPLSPIASLTRDDADGGDTVAVLRGEILFSEAEEVLTRLAPLMGDHGCLVLDFTAVTRVAAGSRKIFSALPTTMGSLADGRPRVEVRDPDGVLAEPTSAG